MTANEDMMQRKYHEGIKRPNAGFQISTGMISFSLDNNRRRLSVLIVDDNPFNLLVLEKYLGMIGTIDIAVDKCLNGELAIESFKSRNHPGADSPFKLIFLDLQLPVKNGFEVCEEINNLIVEENFEKCLVVGISGLVEEYHRNVGLKVGMRKILSKPSNFAEINQICEDIFH